MIGPVSRTDATPSRRDNRLDDAVAEYLLAAEAGRAPDRREFLRDTPTSPASWPRSSTTRTASVGWPAR